MSIRHDTKPERSTSNYKRKKAQPNHIALDREWGLVEAVRNISDYAIFILDPNGFIQTWNAGAEKIKGYSAEEIIGQHFSVFYPPETIQNGHPEYELKIARETGEFKEEGWRLRKNGEAFWANVTITALYDKAGALSGFSKVTRDLTEQKQMEDELRKTKEEAETSRENFRMLIEGVRDYAIILLDPNGIIQSWNIGAQNIKGYSSDEIIGRHFSVFYLPEDVEAGKCDFELKYAEMEGVFEDEGWRLKKDGSKFWASVTITALRNEQGKLIGFTKISSDITSRKDAEQALRESEKRYRIMADKVIERSKAFEAANKQLVILNKELETFSYSVSHDLRAPLRGIDGFSQAMLEDYRDKLDETGVAYLERIRSEAQHMGHLIENLLNLARLNRTEMHRSRVDVTALLQDIAHSLQEQEPERKVIFDIQPGMTANVDEMLIQAALKNLLDNAWKYTSKHETARIEAGMKQENGKTIYFVKDDGAGFSMKYANKLFGVFQRLHGTADFPGTGVGLASVQRIVHRHGGEIWAEGEVEKGASFYFTLEPVA
jgi:PAS domain S-box-containing protein